MIREDVPAALPVLAAIKLNHQFRVKTRKIRDIVTEGHLPPESETAQLTTA